MPKSPHLNRAHFLGQSAKLLLGAVFVTLFGCTIPVISLRDGETERFAVVEIDLQAWLGDNMKGEFAYISHIDGTWEEKYALRKAGRLHTDGPLVKYLLLEPGAHDLTLVYNRNLLSPIGRKIWSGSVTEKAVVTPGRYSVRYEVEGNFVTLWLENSVRLAITEKRRSVIAEVAPPGPTFIPIIIPR